MTLVKRRTATCSGATFLDRLQRVRIGTRLSALYTDAVRRLHTLEAARTKSVSADELPPSFALGFVDSGLWTRYSTTGGHVQTKIHTSHRAEGGAVVLTAEPVLEKMLSGALSSKDALSRELIAIDAPSTESQALGTALTWAFHPAADSPRVGESAQISNSRSSTEGATMEPFAQTTKSMQ